MTQGLEIDIRRARGTDMGLCVSAWVQSYVHAIGWLHGAHSEVKRRVALLVRQHERRTADFLVAVNPYDKEHLYGFVCVKDGVLHYAYTKETYRQAKVMTRLLDGVVKYPLKCSHFTYKMEELADARPGRYVYSPKSAEIFRNKKPATREGGGGGQRNRPEVRYISRGGEGFSPKTQG